MWNQEPQKKDIKEHYHFSTSSKIGGLAFYTCNSGWRRSKSRGYETSLDLTEKQCKNMVWCFETSILEYGHSKEELDAELESGYFYLTFWAPFRIDNPEDVYMKGLIPRIQAHFRPHQESTADRKHFKFLAFI